MAKRSHPPAEEVYSLSDVNGPATNANIHGAVVAISPVKKGKYSKCPFFNGDFADETLKIRLVGFDSLQQRRLSDYHERQVPVEIKNCEIKKSRYGNGYDVIPRSRSIIKMSERQDIEATSIISDHYLPPEDETPDMLEEIQELENRKKINVRVKVTAIHDPVQLIEKTKQEVFLSDQSGSAKLVLWEDNVNSLEKGRSYLMKNLVVRSYQCSKHLIEGKSTTIETIDDIVAVCSGDSEETFQLKSPTIIGVPELETYQVCLKCKSRVEAISETRGSCSSSQCRMMQRYGVCLEFTSAKLLIMYASESGMTAKIVQVLVLSEQMLKNGSEMRL